METVIVKFKPEDKTKHCPGLYQWDRGKYLEVDGLDVTENVQVHFSLTDSVGTAKCYRATVEDGKICVCIPQFILEKEKERGSSYYAYAWVYVSTENHGETIKKIIFTIAARAKPEDYISDPDDAKTWSQLEKRIEKLEKEGASKEQIAQVVEEYLKENPPSETDPTVPEWAKQPTKPSYTAKEVGALPDTTKIPANTSDLKNDSGFITKTVSDLANYYLKTETYSQEEINQKLSAIPKFAIKPVSSLPTSDISETTVYLLKTGEETQNLYTEYIYVDGAWEYLGKQTIDLSGYALKEELPTKLSDLTNDSGFITNAVSNLLNYYKKEETYSKKEIDAKGYLTEHQSLEGYAKSAEVEQHTKDGTIHVTSAEKESWNNKSDFSGSYNDLKDKPKIPTVTVQSVNGKTGAVVLSAGDVGARPNTWTPSASDVGADPSGTAQAKVTEHNTSETSHNDIRLLITGLTNRLNALADSDDTTLDQMSEIVDYIKSNKSLIDGITTGKVSVSDIIDNLTTSVSNKPLSAKQGVQLKALIDAIVVPTLLSQLGEDSTHRTVTDTEKEAWNKKSDFSGSYNDLKDKPTIPSLNGYAKTTDIPTKTSQLQNDSNFVTKDVTDSLSQQMNDLTLGLHTDGLYYIFKNNVPLGTGVLIETSGGATGDVVGNVDTENNIVLSGNLPDGEYTFAYQMEDGTVITIGTLDKNPLPDEPQIINYYDPSTATFNGRIKSNGAVVTDGNTYEVGTVVVDIPNFPVLVSGVPVIIKVNKALEKSGYGSYYGELAFINSSGAIVGKKITLSVGSGNNAGASPQPLHEIEIANGETTITVNLSTTWEPYLPMNTEGLTLRAAVTIKGNGSTVSASDCEGLQIYLPSQTIGG